MAGIKANSASKVMIDGDTSATDVESGYLVGEQITLSTLPAGAAWIWGTAKPSGSKVSASLSSQTSATPTFTPDIAGEYVFTCTVDSVTGYVLRCTVTSVAVSTAIEALRLSPLLDAGVVTPALGGAFFWSSTRSALTVRAADNSVKPVGFLSGAGTPESVITANVGTAYLRTDGGANTTLYIKESGIGATGWVAK